MTRLEHSLLYRADWAWQRTEEGILTLRYYWWCVQCATFVVLPMVRTRYGWKAVVYCVKHAASPAYVYVSCHHWRTTEEEPRSAVDLIITLRQERARRERALFLGSFDGPPVSDSGFSRIVKGTPLHPLLHDDPNPWPSVRGTAPVVYPTEILPPDEEADTALLVPFEWFAPERANV